MVGGQDNWDEAKENLIDEIHDQEWTETKKAQIRAFETIHGFDVLETLKESKGPFTKQGGYINYHEWHSLFIGGGLIDFAFRFQEGAFLYFYMFVMFKVLKDCHKNDKTGPIYEIWKNFHYFIIGGLLAGLLWMETGAPVPEMTIGLVESFAALNGG